MAYRNYSEVSGWIVDQNGQGDFTTIGSALTAASTASYTGDIFIRDATYTENPALVAGVNLVAWNTDAPSGTVIINGECTFSSAGTVNISGIELKTNSNYLLAVTGSSASIINLLNCNLNCLNNTGIDFTSSSSSSIINITNCIGNLGTTSIGIHTSSSSGTINYFGCNFTNTGASTTASSNSAGIVTLQNSIFASAFSTSSTGGIQGYFNYINTSAINTACVTHAGSGSNKEFSMCWFSSGTASGVVVNTNTINLNSCEIISSNTNAVSGTGTLVYSAIYLGGTSVAMNPTSTTQNPSFSGGISFNEGTNVLNVYSNGTWTPTMVGGTTAGTTTYTAQNGYYTRIGNLATIQGVVTGTATTGSGIAQFGSFPFTIKNTTNQASIGCAINQGNTSSWSWAASTTSLSFIGFANTTTGSTETCGSGSNTNSSINIQNATFNMFFSLSHEI